MCCHTPHTPGKENRPEQPPGTPQSASASAERLGGRRNSSDPHPSTAPRHPAGAARPVLPRRARLKEGRAGGQKPSGESCAWRDPPPSSFQPPRGGGTTRSAAPSVLPRSAHASRSKLMAARRLLFALGRRGEDARGRLAPRPPSRAGTGEQKDPENISRLTRSGGERRVRSITVILAERVLYSAKRRGRAQYPFTCSFLSLP